MLREMHWESAAAVASAVVGALVGAPPNAPVLLNVNVPNLALADLTGWQRTSIGRIPPRVIAGAGLEPKIGHPGTYKVVMNWGDAVSLPDGTDGGAIERGRVSVTFVGQLADVDTPMIRQPKMRHIRLSPRLSTMQSVNQAFRDPWWWPRHRPRGR